MTTRIQAALAVLVKALGTTAGAFEDVTFFACSPIPTAFRNAEQEVSMLLENEGPSCVLPSDLLDEIESLVARLRYAYSMPADVRSGVTERIRRLVLALISCIKSDPRSPA